MKIGSTDINDIKIGNTTINKVLRGGVIVYEKGPNGNPSLLNLTVISDTQIDLAWTIGSTNQEGHHIYISTNGTDFTLHGLVIGSTATYSATGLNSLTLYYFKVAAFNGTKLSSYSSVGSDTTLSSESSDILIYVDGAPSENILTDKSGLNNNITVGANLITNGNSELDYGFISQTPAPLINERSSEKSHSGIYSRKLSFSGTQTEMVKSLPFTTKIGEVITYSFWVYPLSGSGTIRWAIMAGNGSTQKALGTLTNVTGPNGAWKQVTGSYTETVAGELAVFAIYMTTTGRVLYLDDIEMTIPEINVLTLPVNTSISNALVNAAKYYTSGNPLNVRVDGISLNDSDQMFFDSSYKILIYGKAVNGKTLASVYDWLSYSAPSLYNYFTTERTAKASATNKHYGFASLCFINNRLFLFYRDATYHNSFDGILKSIYSDDYGVTWSTATTIYTGQEIIDNDPQILIDDPRATPDVRDLQSVVVGNNLLLFGFVAIGHNLAEDDTDPADPANINTRVSWGYKSFCLNIPIASNDLDADNKTISYIVDEPYSRGFAIKDGIYYATTYDVTSLVRLYTSNDGIEWTKKSDVFTAGTLKANESALIFIGEILYCIGRGLTDGVLCRSYDYGTTWQDYTSLGIKIDGLYVNKLTNDKIIVFGRNWSFNKIDLYELSGIAKLGDAITIKTTITDDTGYGNFVEKNGIYYFLYGDGPDAAYPIDDNFAYTGQYLKQIATSKLNAIND